MFRCESTTPFGSPELPLVKSSAASSSPPCAGTPMSEGTHRAGNARTTPSRQATCPRGNACSSAAISQTRSPHGKSANFSESFALKASAVMTRSTSARRRHDCTCSRPNVKLRLTGVLPAKTHAKLATAAAMPGGKTMATRRALVRTRRRFAMTQAKDNTKAPE